MKWPGRQAENFFHDFFGCFQGQQDVDTSNIRAEIKLTVIYSYVLLDLCRSIYSRHIYIYAWRIIRVVTNIIFFNETNQIMYYEHNENIFTSWKYSSYSTSSCCRIAVFSRCEKKKKSRSWLGFQSFRISSEATLWLWVRTQR